jgi:formylglycine-generating enzyme
VAKVNGTLVSVVAGLLVGGLAVLATRLPLSRLASQRTDAPAPPRVSDERAAATPVETSSPAPPSAPETPAACPPEMTLVEGLFCPKLPYRCGRRSSELGHGCAEYVRGVPCEGEPDPRRYCIDRHEWPNRIGVEPRVYVDWFEAKALCQSAGKRLCRRSEWILACEGPKRLPYPWGFVRQPSPCNVDRAAIPFDVNAMLDDRTRDEELARLWQADAIGSHPDCVSAFGAYDLAGNVDEWTDNLADDPATDRPSTLNGGYWGPVRNTCRLTTKSHGPTFTFYQAGFRCCGDTQDGVEVAPPRPFVERPDPGHEDG